VKNTIRILIVALTSLAFSSVSFAQAKPATPATPATPAPPAMEKKTEMRSEKAKAEGLTGEVTSVDAKAGTLTLKGKEKEINLAADSKSTKAALEKLKVGDRVRVSDTEKDGKMIVSSVKAAKSDKGTEKKGEMTEKKSK
jgi:Cu/Ag efflux protein CusF